jgi:PleD family two-component response regulator
MDAALGAGPRHGSVTVGVAALRPGESAGDLIARADALLYEQRQRRQHPPG